MKKIYPERNRRIVITGGHLTPALAVIQFFQKKDSWQILFIGRQHAMEGDQAPSVEAQVVPKMGIDFVTIKAGRLPRTTTRYTLLAMSKIPLGFFQAFNYLLKFKPDVILSFGGYLAVPVVLAGWLLRIPVVTHEQSLRPGLATRLISFFASKIAVSWQESTAFFPKNKVVFTGNPLRQEILRLPNRQAAKPPSRPTIYITGGNQGAHAINAVIGQCLPLLLKKYRIVHQCGTVEYFHDYEKLQRRASRLPLGLKKDYRLGRWFDSQKVAKILAQADLVISRSGANTVFELAFLGKPAILIPFPFLKEQEDNARCLAQTGLVELLLQQELSPTRLMFIIKKMISNLEKYQKAGKQARQMVKVDAGRRLVELVRKCGS